MTPSERERIEAIAQEVVVLIGRSLVDRGYNCCGKPHGCTNMNPGCAYLPHPYKKWARGEITLAELEAKAARG